MVTLGQSLGPKAPQPEPEHQPCKLIKKCQQVNRSIACGAWFDKTEEKRCILEKESYGRR